MKKTLKFAAMVMVAVAALSCKKQETVITGDATCTFIPNGSSFYISVDEDLAFVPTNAKGYPFEDGKERRALISYIMDENTKVDPVPGYAQTKAVSVTFYELIKTKEPLAAKDGLKLGNDPIGLYLGKDVFPTTLIEDGYLNVCFAFEYAYGNIKHDLNLVYGENPNDPYELRLYHNANNDGNRYSSTSLFCFPLKDLPDTEGKTVTVTLKWDSLKTGKVESTTFQYKSRSDWSTY